MSKDETFLRRWSRRKHESAQAAGIEARPVESAAPPRLPPVEDLGFESDFRVFMRPEVERETRGAALKKLFMSPHYRATDGLDVYVGDYSSPDPLPAAMLAGLVHARGLVTDAKPDAPTEPGAPKSIAPEAEASAAQAVKTASEERQSDPANDMAGPPVRVDVSAESKYFQLRERAGWSEEGAAAAPKIAALLAAAGLPEADPVPSVSYRSEGKLLIVGDAGLALRWAGELADTLDVSVLITGGDGAELPVDRRFAVMSGEVTRVEGYLGNFNVAWEQVNPIDFERKERVRSDRFDLILNLSDRMLFSMPQPPQGYFAPGSDPAAQATAIKEIVTAVGEFEKPRYFQYDAKICAHSRSKLKGCNQCLDVCSTQAIAADGDRVKVDPHLCMGCGACASVCPSGAMSYAYPKMSFQGEKLRAMLGAYREAGGKDACLLFHNGTDGRDLILELGRRRGLPARVIPVETFHVASLGLDLLLGAVALGAGQVLVVSAGSEAPGYFEALRRQMGFGAEILRGFGYRGSHFELIVTGDPRVLEQHIWSLDTAQSPAEPTEFRLFDDKRTSLAFTIEHLATHAPTPRTVIALSAGAPFGEIEVNLDTCTMCMACVGACPEAALADGRDQPQLRFVEANCVQCGLCEQACPEDAIALAPRLLIGKEAKAERVLNQDQPFHCIRCGKEFGTHRMLQSMLAKIAGHSMFSAPGALERMKMCGDCRVVDMIEKGGEVSVFDLKR